MHEKMEEKSDDDLEKYTTQVANNLLDFYHTQSPRHTLFLLEDPSLSEEPSDRHSHNRHMGCRHTRTHRTMLTLFDDLDTQRHRHRPTRYSHLAPGHVKTTRVAIDDWPAAGAVVDTVTAQLTQHGLGRHPQDRSCHHEVRRTGCLVVLEVLARTDRDRMERQM